MGAKLDLSDNARQQAINAAAMFADACAKLRDGPQPLPLDEVINGLMAELWDNCFSQTEIWTAFLGALDNVNLHAAGEERRA